jgi:RimJ/RimL family protein N-acetyltransferase
LKFFGFLWRSLSIDRKEGAYGDEFAILEQMDKSIYLLRTDRLGLRRWNASDVEVFARMNADPTVMEYFPRPWTAAESAALECLRFGMKDLRMSRIYLWESLIIRR